MAAVNVTLGGLSFNAATVDGNGAKWRIARIEGWDSPSVRQSLFDPTGVHGQVVAEILYGSRAIVLTGTCTTPSEAAYWLSHTALATATNSLAIPGTLVVNEPTPKQASVVRAGEVRMRPIGAYRGFEFEVPLLAPDPRKYATTAVSGALTGSDIVANAGNIETYPTLTVVGPSTSPMTFTLGARVVTLNISLAGGETLVADFAARTVLVNGVNRYDVVASSTRWWALAAGNNTVGSSAGGGTASLSRRSAWI